ncbi:MAG TPA: site-specific DNA-methyltransferase [Ktedonobacteraceae bacterium]|nr:site-specific DNA-methyltransferase [Ktedonobacteraceae bacterium]
MISEDRIMHTVPTPTIRRAFETYSRGQDIAPLFISGNALTVLKQLPAETIDFCMTSPPYWNKREYIHQGIGLEDTYQEYIVNLLAVFAQVKRILKPTGSFWLNIGDTYLNKTLVGIPWRVALKMTDEQGWILRNSVVWNKVKGGLDNTQDRLRNVHESIFHFVKIPKDYYYNIDGIRSEPGKAKVVNGSIVSATGVSGVRYRRQIELSTSLTAEEKKAAMKALGEMLAKVSMGKLADFRMIIRNQQRTTHSESERVSGRARELKEKGFYFLIYHPEGSKPADVWDILPEDTQKRTEHFAPYPADLCKIPILATCPSDGIVLDPFCGTGTTMYVAQNLERKSVGIDLSKEYLQLAEERCTRLL